jgi:O-antigen biosynthesis protein
VQLSIIIVNYNVKYFLEHCIISTMAACKNIAAQIIVVDNASTDDSVALLQTNYPNVITIANSKNVGFAAANNQGLQIATGQYILYLNPDTIVAEDCFEKCMAYLQQHPTVGALGPKLIDGKGVFLPESKRGFPGFAAAFYKISGLSTLFKKSTTFNQYHLGFLPTDATNVVDVLAGCFMMMPRKVVDIVGGFSEDYFMYGEDIDLSYCVQKAGFQNVYFADTAVIHYKGESTKKGSLNYVKLFYNAMIIFAKKHLAPSKQSTFIPLIKLAITLRALVSVVSGVVKSMMLPLLDAGMVLFSLWQTKNYWLTYVKTDTSYSNQTLYLFFATYSIIWLSTLFINGGYDVPLKKNNILKGIGIGMLITLAIYGLLPETTRFSRGITLLGGTASAILIWCARSILQAMGVLQIASTNSNKDQSILIVANATENTEVKQLLKTANIDRDVIGNVSTHNQPATADDLGTIQQLQSIAASYQAAEIIFTYPANTFTTIIDKIQQLGSTYNYKIHATNTDSIIGSNSKNTAGDLYAADWHFAIAKPSGKRTKRTFDVISALLVLLLSPVLLLIVKPKNILANAWQVLIGKHTWVGYSVQSNTTKLPKINPCIIPIDYNTGAAAFNTELLNIQYARNYTASKDWQLLKQYLFH